VESDFDWKGSTELPKSKRHRSRSRSQVILAMLLAVGGPCVVCEIRGLTWESLLGSIVIFAIGLRVVRPPFSLWLAAVLLVGVCGTGGLIGWSGWRFHTLDVFSSYSPRLMICGRYYQPQGPAQRKLPAPFKSLTQQVMGVMPSGSAILGTGCQTTVLYVETPGPRYQPYELLGGP
jgi:hypothetical protein